MTSAPRNLILDELGIEEECFPDSPFPVDEQLLRMFASRSKFLDQSEVRFAELMIERYQNWYDAYRMQVCQMHKLSNWDFWGERLYRFIITAFWIFVISIAVSGFFKTQYPFHIYWCAMPFLAGLMFSRTRSHSIVGLSIALSSLFISTVLSLQPNVSESDLILKLNEINVLENVEPGTLEVYTFGENPSDGIVYIYPPKKPDASKFGVHTIVYGTLSDGNGKLPQLLIESLAKYGNQDDVERFKQLTNSKSISQIGFSKINSSALLEVNKGQTLFVYLLTNEDRSTYTSYLEPFRCKVIDRTEFIESIKN